VVAAAIRLKGDGNLNPDAAAEQEMIAWCASTLAKFKIPKYVRFVTGFPMTASGKIQKYKLREEHQQLLRT
jgi:fatty-acyl-CoA synthase